MGDDDALHASVQALLRVGGAEHALDDEGQLGALDIGFQFLHRAGAHFQAEHDVRLAVAAEGMIQIHADSQRARSLGTIHALQHHVFIVIGLDDLDGTCARSGDAVKLLDLAHARPVHGVCQLGAFGHLHHAVALVALSFQVRKRRHHDGGGEGFAVKVQRGVGNFVVDVTHFDENLVKIGACDRVCVHRFFSLIHKESHPFLCLMI